MLFDLSQAAGVLLVPAEGDPTGLLAPGRCNSRPPLVSLFRCSHMFRTTEVWAETFRALATPENVDMSDITYRKIGEALPLWWEGEIVWGGMGRAAVACKSAPYSLIHPTLADVVDFARFLARHSSSTVVLVDADGRGLAL